MCAEPEACCSAETQAPFPKRLGACQPAVCAVPWEWQPTVTVSLIVTAPGDPGAQAPTLLRPLEPGVQWGSPWVAAAKARALHVRERAGLGDAGAVEQGRGRAQR